MEHQQIIDNIKGILHYVVEYQESKGYDNFDYGCNYDSDTWECSFFDEDGNVVEHFEGKSAVDIVNQLINQ